MAKFWHRFEAMVQLETKQATLESMGVVYIADTVISAPCMTQAGNNKHEHSTVASALKISTHH